MGILVVGYFVAHYRNLSNDSVYHKIALSTRSSPGVEFMALDHVQFTDRFGRPIPQKLRDQLVECVISAIAHPKADIEAVLKRAQTIARRAADGQIEDVRHYATKALFAVSRKASLKRERERVASQSGNSGWRGDKG
ncbi:MAG: hypothetical protein ACR2IV_02035 [Bryobacteraceae bacterium]